MAESGVKRNMMGHKSFTLQRAGENLEKESEDFYERLKKKEEADKARMASGAQASSSAKLAKKILAPPVVRGSVNGMSSMGTNRDSSLAYGNRVSSMGGAQLYKAAAAEASANAPTDLICTFKLVETLTAPGHTAPLARSGHASFMLARNDPRLIIFAGAADDQYFDDLQILNLETKRWFRSHTYLKPAPRSYAAVTVISYDPAKVGDVDKILTPRLLCFGGFNKGQIDADVFLLDDWDVALSGPGGASKAIALPVGIRARDTPLESQITNIWNKIECRGDVPLGRCNHTAVLHANNRDVVYFGGWHGSFVNDVYALDTEKWVWKHHVCKTDAGRMPRPRGSHASCIIPERNIMVTFGGQNDSGMMNDLWVLNLNTYEWVKPTVVGFPPAPRSGHTLTYDLERKKIFLFGGFDGNTVRDDIHVLNVANEVQDGWSWETHTVKGAIVKPRTGHAAQLVKGHLYIHGGWSQNMFLDDVVKVEIETDKRDLDTRNRLKAKNLEGTEDYALFMEKLKLLALERRPSQALTVDQLSREVLDELNNEVIARMQHAQSKVNQNRQQTLQQERERQYQLQLDAIAKAQAVRKKVMDTCMAHGATQKEALAIANGYADEDTVQRIVRRIKGEDAEEAHNQQGAGLMGRGGAPSAPPGGRPPPPPSDGAQPPPPPPPPPPATMPAKEYRARMQLAAPTQTNMRTALAQALEAEAAEGTTTVAAAAAAVEETKKKTVTMDPEAVAEKEREEDPLSALEEIIATGGGLMKPGADLQQLLDDAVDHMREALEEDQDLSEDPAAEGPSQKKATASFRGLVSQMRTTRRILGNASSKGLGAPGAAPKRELLAIPLAKPSKEPVRPYRHVDIKDAADIPGRPDNKAVAADGAAPSHIVPFADSGSVVHIPGIDLKLPARDAPAELVRLVVNVQRRWKGYKTRKMIERVRAIVKIQALVRGFLTRRRLAQQGLAVASLARVREMMTHAQRVKRYEHARLRLLGDLGMTVASVTERRAMGTVIPGLGRKASLVGVGAGFS